MATIPRTTTSLSDVPDIVDHIAADDPAAADRVLVAIDATFRSLAESPMIGRTREELAVGLRSLPAAAYPR